MSQLTRVKPSIEPTRVTRAEFLYDVWDYNRGQHVTLVGPTQRGKTTFCFQLLKVTATPHLKALVLVGKPTDPTINKWIPKLNMRVVDSWPPGYNVKDRNRDGWILKPRHSLTNLDADRDNLRHQFRRGMMSAYATKLDKPMIVLVDEAHHVQNELQLKQEYEAILMRGAPRVGEWSNLQRGRFSSYLTYDSPEHMFIFYDPDRANQQRYSEFGGVDAQTMVAISEQLKTYRVPSGGTISEALYIKRAGPEIYIVGV